MSSLDHLSREDAEILALERGAVAGHTVKVFLLDRSPDVPPLTLPRLRARVGARLDRLPRARQRLAPTPLGLASPVWVDDDAFDLDRHVRRAPTRGTVSDARLSALIGEAMSGRLPRDRPLWDLQLVGPLPGRRVAVLARFHHAWLDGLASLNAVRALLYDEPGDDGAASDGWRPVPGPGTAELVASAVRQRVGVLAGAAGALARTAVSPDRWRLGAQELGRLPGAVGRELLPSSVRSPFAGSIGRRRTMAWTSAPLADYKAVEHVAGEHTTVNDVVLAVVAGGLRTWLGHAARDRPLRCKVPVSLHRRDEGPDVGNRDSFMIVDLPVGDRDPWARLRAIHRQTAERKRHHDAETLDALFGDLALVAPPLERLLSRVTRSSREFVVSVSNIPGPREPVAILGARLAELMVFGEIALDHAVRVSAVSLCGVLAIGLCGDPEVVPDLDGLATAMGDALAELRAHAP
ncbi:MAG TPA: wax ester/triacylglycerol synthase family O-acyltransferase [Solirubrobacteraceae bacterium]|jgi:WS/DGAT/MGAT family acyltransferase|nr:wax ester/triacylglycerol synthase family O-acyltransferase [Solirubrobacteraceae bacterium]